MAKINISPVSRNVPFDNTSNSFTSTNVQNAIEEIGASASPGFSFGRSSTTGAGTWLFRTGNIPSNKTGVPMGITSPIITTIQVGNEDISTFDIEIYEHEGNEINLTLLTTVNIIASRTGVFQVSVPATSGRHLAVKVSTGTGKNIGVDIVLKGSV